ncbi:hypothetical protein MPLDJ20_330014 [Mesorhizobium plurifarium]|uniref:Uncharacterized protein n=1 Tax=Mesorhizobium plurifarium TaxID=69974 RepID=A0A090FIG4_MESPL|nr:hypothetical protein MPLDJ20_330014 [Mesorhizobium plurifarium]
MTMRALRSDGTFFVDDRAASQADAAGARTTRPASCWERIDEQINDRSNAWRPHTDGRRLRQGDRSGG